MVQIGLQRPWRRTSKNELDTLVIYDISRISHLYVHKDGKILIKWPGSPNPSPCGGNNYGWLTITRDSDKSLKAMAMLLYSLEKPARIDTAGCDGSREIISVIYSPGG